MKNHESAILVVLSYIIGFTTAFIMFVLVDDVKNKKVDQVSDTDAIEADLLMPKVVELMETSEGLFVKSDGKERIISARTEDSEARPGFHTDIVTSSISPDSKYVHYCAEMSSDAGVCRHFVYSISEDSTYAIKNADGPIETVSEEATTWSWSEDSSLRSGESKVDASSRWVLR